MDLGNVGVVEAGKNLCLPSEPGEPVRIAGEGVREDLQGDLAVQLCVASAQDDAHPAGTEFTGHFERSQSVAGAQGHDTWLLRGKRPTGAFS